jgi:hypothetical protein
MFQLIPSTNLRELGEYSQVDTIQGTYDPNSRRIIEGVHKNERLPPDIAFPDLKLYPKANYTDIVYSTVWGHLYLALSQHAYSLISQLSLGPHQVFESKLHRRNDVETYKVLYLVNDHTNEFIDWNQSVFTYWQSMGHVEKERLSIADEADYLERVRKLHFLSDDLPNNISIRLKSLVLKDELSHLDLFRLSIPALGYYVSSKFKELVEENQLTGFAFESIEEINRRKSDVKPWPGYQ